MKLLERARENQVGFPATVSTPYVNTIPPDQEPWFPGDEHIERRIRAYIRWNAAIMVVRANHAAEGIGGHLATFASSASLYEVGFNHFFRGKDNGQAGDQVFFQGHAAPGHLRPGLHGGPPHRGAARVLPDGAAGPRRPGSGRVCRRTPTPGSCPTSGSSRPSRWASARSTPSTRPTSTATCNNRRIADTSQSRVWCFLGDGECDEPETLGALSLAGAGAARQSDLRRQLQPAAPRRPGPRQRQDHPGAGGHLPRRRLERHQGDLGLASGTSCWPATSTACSSTR